MGQSAGKAQPHFLARGIGCGMVTSLPREWDKIRSSVSETEIWSPPVPPANPPKQEPLLFIVPSCSLCRYEPSSGTQQSWHNKVLPLPLSVEGVMLSGFSSFSSQWLNLFCVMLMAALHLPGCQFPRPSQGRELPKEGLQPWGSGSWRSHL